MWNLIFADLYRGFSKTWSLYFANTLCVFIIIVLFAYLDGAKRQLNLQNTVYSGEIVLKIGKTVPGIEDSLKAWLLGLESISQKTRTTVSCKIPGQAGSESVEIVGVDFSKETKLKNYLSISKGTMVSRQSEVLIPSSLLEKLDIDTGIAVNVMGKTSEDAYNTGVFDVCGIYESPSLSVGYVSKPKLFIDIKEMEQFFQPQPKDREYCLFFNDGKIPADVDLVLTNHLGAETIDSITEPRISSFDILNIAFQFHIFLVIIVSLIVGILLTIVVFSNFTVYSILFKNRRNETGALVALGVPQVKIAAVLFIESIIQVFLCCFLGLMCAQLLTVIAGLNLAKGELEVLLVLISGTNRVDLYIQNYQVFYAFFCLAGAASISQVPIFVNTLRYMPTDIMRR